MIFENDMAKFEEQPDGSVKITTKDGRIVVIDKDGNAQTDLSNIKNVGIESISDLESYTIMRDGDLTVHNGVYRDGGYFKIAYTSDGKLEEFSGKNIGQTITRDNEITLRSSTAAAKLNEQ